MRVLQDFARNLVKQWPFTRKKEESGMGGLNESVLEADKGKDKKDQVLQADPDPKGSVLQADPQAAPVTASKKTDAPKAEKPSAPPDLGAADLPHQYQNIRQHVSGGHCHFHDDANKLKLSIPVAEWYVICAAPNPTPGLIPNSRRSAISGHISTTDWSIKFSPDTV